MVEEVLGIMKSQPQHLLQDVQHSNTWKQSIRRQGKNLTG